MSLFGTSVQVGIKKLNKNAVIPAYANEFAGGADIYACIEKDIEIAPHETKLIPTGFAMEFCSGLVALIYARSGLASKKGLAPANKVGVIDCDYRGEVMVALHNHSDIPQTVSPRERIAQMVITPYLHGDFTEVDELTQTERGSGGFGSTGSK